MYCLRLKKRHRSVNTLSGKRRSWLLLQRARVAVWVRPGWSVLNQAHPRALGMEQAPPVQAAAQASGSGRRSRGQICRAEPRPGLPGAVQAPLGWPGLQDQDVSKASRQDPALLSGPPPHPPARTTRVLSDSGCQFLSPPRKARDCLRGQLPEGVTSPGLSFRGDWDCLVTTSTTCSQSS